MDYQKFIIQSKKLQRDLVIYIYLPKSYHNDNRRYPVLYMHDGEIIFNDFNNDESEIGILHDYMQDTTTKEIILVGIGSGNGTLRLDDLCPFPTRNQQTNQMVGGKTDTYFDFIIEELMPVINQRYKTKTGSIDTGMLGISLGGLCSLYATTRLTSHISRFAFVSSALSYVQTEIVDILQQSEFQDVIALYSDVGTQEFANQEVAKKYLTSNKEIYAILNEKPFLENFSYHIIEGSKHETSYWNKRFIDIVEFLFE